MSEYTFNGEITNLDEYDVEIDSTYYDKDYDDVGFEEPTDNEVLIPQTDILFE